ncbi:hypothetical protein K227x_44280 [Rubripirellula lacrimiformis]|uniref:Uncharacterized protein n=1 Tax=Rubripirellula lacrimiformis TaxID=1930273 RepID=A0A517NFZ1_9BACT|nr:prepilin-type N-terminal cleavage/methylation domain-containing protein [Rubripirellula lacrimiformis]QDT06021.1 hypothetical protein K227x_44280 [Rubripirellula lacrimiformis]
MIDLPTSTDRFRGFRRAASLAFSLVELLIAMTITMLLMAALAKSFGVIGKSIKEGRSQVSLSSKLRGASFRLRTDLGARTAIANPPLKTEAGLGYFMYYEGPMTEHTMGLFGAEATRTRSDGTVIFQSDTTDTDGDSVTDFYDPDIEKGATYRKHARIGDFDDYLAFTAEASGDQWFTGKVPAYLVDDAATDEMEPRVIRSKFAEIIIWASPVWDVDPATNLINIAAHPSGMPLYKDSNNDLVPDRIVLHQRTLLIRPDLNRVRTIPGSKPFDTAVLRPQDDNVSPSFVPPALRQVYPIGVVNAPESPLYPNYAVPTSATNNAQMLNSNWLVGMTPLHHFYDLSLRRVIHPETGEPTGYVAANSMTDLVQPHNRFAHVRYPGRYFGRGDFTSGDLATSMPLLALGWNDVLLNWQGTADPRSIPASATAPSWFPLGQTSARTRNTAGTPTTGDDSLSGLFNGWLLPHFALGDANQPGTSQGDHWERGYLPAGAAFEDPRWDRTGEDVFVSNVLSYDIRVFDESAPVFITGGPDGDPGKSGVDDDGTGTADETVTVGGSARSELGAAGSDDLLVEVSDMAIYDVIGQEILHPQVAGTFGYDFVSLGSRGAFVDLGFPFLAGTPLGQRMAQSVETGEVATPRPSTTVAPVPRIQTNFNLFMQSDFSLLPMVQPTATDGLSPMKRSGKLVHFDAFGNICFFQPTYDTWTDGYESDGFDQSQTPAGQLSGANLVGTTWVLSDPGTSATAPVPRLPTGVKNVLQVDTGRFVPSEPETSAPFPRRLQAISVTMRVLDPSSEEIAQFTVVESLE